MPTKAKVQEPILDPVEWAKTHATANGKIPWHMQVPDEEWPNFLNNLGSRVMARWCKEELARKYPDEKWPAKATRHTVDLLREKAQERGMWVWERGA